MPLVGGGSLHQSVLQHSQAAGVTSTRRAPTAMATPAPMHKSHHVDSTKWDAVTPRDDDVVIVTSYKSGTTWMQTVVAEILFQGREKPGSVGDMSPWVDMRVPVAEVTGPQLEAQQHRRFMKTHLPADAFRPYFNPKASAATAATPSCRS